MGKFEKSVESLVDILTLQSNKIEKSKLLAIGIRNKVESETENRKRKQHELLNDIAQKKAEIERRSVQIESLGKIVQEQRVLLDHLQSVE